MTLSFAPAQKERLESIAEEVGALWGGRPNISELIRMIADGRVILYKPGTPITQGDQEYFAQQLNDLQAILENLKRL